MLYLIISFLLNISTNPQLIFEFNKDSNLSNWKIVNDGVMGGLSKGGLELNNKGKAEFFGFVSLENNGGFTSLRYQPNPITFVTKKKVVLTIKGDGKTYQFRVKKSTNDYASFITTFKTSGKWETIEITLADLYPSWRGRKLDQLNFSGDKIEEITFLIANKVEESFKLQIEKIELN